MEVNIEITCVWNDDSSSTLEKLGLESNWDNLPERSVTFLSIDNYYAPETDKEEMKYTLIYSGGTNFLCRMPYEEFKFIINQHIKQKNVRGK